MTYRDGTRFPHVTDILADAGLIDVKWLTEEARDRGTALHYATVLDDASELDEASVDPGVRPYLTAYRAAKRELTPVVSATEAFVENNVLAYCGTLDRVWVGSKTGAPGLWPEVVIDIKTGQSEPWHGPQLAAYAACDRFPVPPARANLYLRADGSFALVRRDDRTDWAVFKAVLTLYYWKRRQQWRAN